MKTNEYVICQVCNKKFVGKIPKNGDGSILVPRLHKIKIYNVNVIDDYLSPVFIYEICRGSYQEGIIVNNE